MNARIPPRIEAVSTSPTHTMGKQNQPRIRLIAGLGVEGDANMGVTVKHRSRVRCDPSQPNRRQVHLIHAELHDELRDAGFGEIRPCEMGENITTRGVDLLDLPTASRLHLGATAIVEITGLRNPCVQLDGVRPGLMRAVLATNAVGELVRKAGVMGIVIVGGEVGTGDEIRIEWPAEPHTPLQPV